MSRLGTPSRWLPVTALVTALAIGLSVSPAQAATHNSPNTAPSSTVSSDATGLQAQIQAAQSSLNPGEIQLVTTVNGYDLYAQADATGVTSVLAVPEGASPNPTFEAYGICTIAVTAAVFALGAAAIGVAAATGGLEIAGVFLAPNVLNLLAGAMGSYSALEGLIALYVC